MYRELENDKSGVNEVKSVDAEAEYRIGSAAPVEAECD